MVIYLKAEDRYLVLEYMTQAPGAAIAGEISTDTSSNPPSVESLAIPGVVHGTMTALEKYGSGNLTRRRGEIRLHPAPALEHQHRGPV